ncbi:MAG: FAD-binding protein [Magnetococcales bacterium]|nr:FAD-binding protein [Magnetococcales bacterium]
MTTPGKRVSSPLPPSLPEGFLSALDRAMARSARLLTDPAALEAYAWDNTGIRFRPQVVVIATTTDDVAKTLALCHARGVAVIPRGAGTGNVGGALAVRGGLVLSTQRMNRIHEIRPQDRLAVVEPGLVNADLQVALKPHRLFWPPDPSSARACTIGGNIAMCAAGPNAPRYGVTRDWVLGLEAVLPDGTLIQTGGRTTKGVVGYDLTRLLIGSEGTLAVVTRAILRLAPLPAARRLLRAAFASVSSAVQAISALMAEGTPPTAIEFMDPACLDILRQGGNVALPHDARAMLLLEVSGDSDVVATLAQHTLAALEPFQPLEVLQATTPEEAAKVWEARYAMAPTLKKIAPRRINEDVVVPVSRLPELIDGLATIARESGIPIVNFGHGGNGNIHVNLLADPHNPHSLDHVGPVLDRVFSLVLALDGTLSGEHGVGIQKMAFIDREIPPHSLDLQRRIKDLFDPKGILNPGKIFPPRQQAL